jgi:hypothetical protein
MYITVAITDTVLVIFWNVQKNKRPSNSPFVFPLNRNWALVQNSRKFVHSISLRKFTNTLKTQDSDYQNESEYFSGLAFRYPIITVTVTAMWHREKWCHLRLARDQSLYLYPCVSSIILPSDSQARRMWRQGQPCVEAGLSSIFICNHMFLGFHWKQYASLKAFPSSMILPSDTQQL